MTMQIHCVYNVHTCQTVKGQVFCFPPDADLIGKNINPCLGVTMAHEMPLEETSMCKEKKNTQAETRGCHFTDRCKLVNNVTQLNIQ